MRRRYNVACRVDDDFSDDFKKFVSVVLETVKTTNNPQSVQMKE